MFDEFKEYGRIESINMKYYNDGTAAAYVEVDNLEQENYVFNIFFIKNLILTDLILCRSAEEAVYEMNNYFDVDFVNGSLKKTFQRDDYGEIFIVYFFLAQFCNIFESVGYVKVWTDGCCLGNGYQGSKGAIAVSFGTDNPLYASIYALILKFLY